jgi:hypothetical protein
MSVNPSKRWPKVHELAYFKTQSYQGFERILPLMKHPENRGLYLFKKKNVMLNSITFSVEYFL